ncbi:MAG: MG2 domain-containing protein, partial [Acidobacteria bacterium]|nr:MG2 domain-containing protein [Acidobacteriota bacterium]
PGESAFEVPLPLSSSSDPLLLRLRYRITPGEKNYTALAPQRGMLSFAHLAGYAFTLGVLTAGKPIEEKPYEIRTLTFHPVTGRPVAGVAVRLGQVQATSGADGVALLRIEDPSAVAGFQISARIGDFRQQTTIERPDLAEGDLQIHTDKPLYQPGQTMHVRLLERAADGASRAEADRRIRILDEDGLAVHTAPVTTSRFGIASTDWNIPANTRSGTYNIEVESPEFDDPVTRPVTIRRYELPSFRVTTRLDHPYYLPNQKVNIDIGGEYLFGKPVTSGSVRILEEDEEKPLVEGTLDATGHFGGAIHSGGAPTGNSRFLDRHFTAFVTDASTHRTEQRKFDLRVSRDPLHVYIARRNHTRTGSRIFVTVSSPDGAPAQATVEIVVDNKTIAAGRTNRFGVARLILPPTDKYEAVVRARTADGRTANEPSWLLDNDPPGILLETVRTLHHPGEAVHCQITSPVKNLPALLLAINASGEVVFSQSLTLQNGQAEVAIPYNQRFGRVLSLHAASALPSVSS